MQRATIRGRFTEVGGTLEQVVRFTLSSAHASLPESPATSIKAHTGHSVLGDDDGASSVDRDMADLQARPLTKPKWALTLR